MRIVAGDFGGRRLSAVPGMATRPTTDKVKEALFNIIGPYFNGGISLDLYGGSGGLSIEGISRGIEHAVLVDRAYPAIKTIKGNIEVTKHPEKFTVLKMDSRKALTILQKQGKKFDLIYLDPPYAKQQIVKDMARLAELGLLNDNALVVAETNQEANLPIDIDSFRFIKKQSYGITVLNFYRFERG
ncbi:16S rRNA (guanine(966)-N(2))-methyltransferase RsmD [Limosilactobacillus fastidiosus]|uniref:16S rRNA (Guanine(966)-N(2))-methyltransferase RsmD n=1 Tax=Limosilactobacillus fastidiosus TaxID=2759855 RepID=A0A7W3TY77_9LACO|nr:16S rRNA (guanine(966)-N(2))-methyltransferase RsmD [Limosilactobacillus fastidiosus]MBB1062324.1 16S rRNA (guanine(966)-N(2))-methyltransferase RsmD [Limosilactobacillus fastidiosus]MBB1085235.1 16S rRNA (guanine(966)-N(2))-methyltransferase RsmD [Limosilactobacillus fastidiosus]MCD7083401.1 16S rRNA (guanine(966)-N(2))-methyltransferase RsmD [Limosilactobacillus fastidiosus]MCD7085221.1 16S rRNA (guanine(966)-N(2))-methyltransferase RsmD [Limosilactobacillus fastidiosus]MCD7115164.1 16S r